jgi:hypothetical protein
MTEPEKSQLPPAEPEADSEPSNPGGKASTVPEGEIKGCTTDTIADGDGGYLEPPD